MNSTEPKLSFSSDYMEGCHPELLRRLVETNLYKSPGYGTDEYCERARALIREACGAPDAAVYFLVGGTQTNATVIDALLHSYQGVIAADTGHISIHEAGAIELGGHKVLTLPHSDGKLTAARVEEYLREYWADETHEHMVMPGMVYISQPTEMGTLYSLSELRALSALCRENDVALYLDGARLAYALACPENDATLEDIAALCDVFYIGGTKCGALFGEAVVVPEAGRLPHFFTVMKQHGALLAKGRLLGVQFEALFTDGLYLRIGASAIAAAERMRALLKSRGFELCFNSPTNQVFCVVDDALLPRLTEAAGAGFWARGGERRSIVRFATSWATTDADLLHLERALDELLGG